MSKPQQPDPLPTVHMQSLRNLARWVNVIERMLRDEYVPEADVPAGWGNDGCGIPLTSLQQLDASAHIACKQVLRNALAYTDLQVRSVFSQALNGFRQGASPVEADKPS